MNVQNRSTNLHFYIHHTCDLLRHAEAYSELEISKILKEIADDLEKCNQKGRFCSPNSFRKILLQELPALEALIEDGGILDHLESATIECSPDILKLRTCVGLLAWKIFNI
jgi:hypothetical protein